jgi:2'-5' RNA ligase
MLRLFAALTVPRDVAERLQALQAGLEGRIVPPENLHLTLAFFGEIDEARAEDLHAALQAVDGPAPMVTLDGVGAFGNSRPHAIYAAARPEPALIQLQSKVAQAGRRAGLALEKRRFTPHVTLSRYKPGQLPPREAAKRIEARAAFLARSFTAESFALHRSELGRSGPSYTRLHDYPLA